MKIQTLTTTVSILLLGAGFTLAQNRDCPRGGKGKGKCGEGRGACETVCIENGQLFAKGKGGGNGEGKRDRRRDGTGGGCQKATV